MNVQVILQDDSTTADLRTAFAKASQEIVLRGSEVIDNGEGHDDQLQIRRFNEDLYVVSGFELQDPNISHVSAKLQELQASPPPEMMQGKYLPIIFQHGPRPTAGYNGVTLEALLAVCANRLESFQASPYACQENAEALAHLHDAIKCLNRRAARREATGTLGTNTPESETLNVGAPQSY